MDLNLCMALWRRDLCKWCFDKFPLWGLLWHLSAGTSILPVACRMGSLSNGNRSQFRAHSSISISESLHSMCFLVYENVDIRLNIEASNALSIFHYQHFRLAR